MATVKPASEQIEDAPSTGQVEPPSGSGIEKSLSNIENDPHRAALEDNPPEPERMTFMKGIAIFVSALPAIQSLA
jgi:hypothetical protein